MKKITVWEPDTCGCVIEIHWDNEEEPGARTYKYVARVACQYHRGPDGVLAARAENLLKCAVVGATQETAGWHFTADRKLVVDLERRYEAQARAAAAAHGREVIFVVR